MYYSSEKTQPYFAIINTIKRNMKTKHDPLSQYHQQDKLLWLLTYTQDLEKFEKVQVGRYFLHSNLV